MVNDASKCYGGILRTLIRIVDRAFKAVLVIFLTSAAFFMDGLSMIDQAVIFLVYLWI